MDEEEWEVLDLVYQGELRELFNMIYLQYMMKIEFKINTLETSC